MRIVRLDHCAYVEEQVHEGGFGRVHCMRRADGRGDAPAPYLGRVAAKSFHASVPVDAIWRELSPWLDLAHANVVPLLTIGVLEYQTVAVMPWREASLADVLRDRGPLSPQSAVLVARDILIALKYAYDAQQLLHLDVKPANVLVHKDLVEVADWGIARVAAAYPKEAEGRASDLCRTALRVGTLPFMAPERLSGAWALSVRTDLFSVGMLLFQLVTGALPFRGDAAFPRQLSDGSYFEQARQLLTSLSMNIQPAILRMMAPDASDRPSSHDEALDVLMWVAKKNKHER